MPSKSSDLITEALKHSLKKNKVGRALDNKLTVSVNKVLCTKLEFVHSDDPALNLDELLKKKYIVLKPDPSVCSVCLKDSNDVPVNKEEKQKELGACVPVNKEEKQKELGACVKQKCESNFEVWTMRPIQENTGDSTTLPAPKLVLFPIERVKLGWRGSVPVGAGLVNLGTTCYINSTLQALFHVPSFVNWLLEEKDHQLHCEKKNGNFHNDCVLCAVLKTIQLTHRANGSSIKPKYIIEKVKLICRHLSPMRQEDAHEFLRYLMEAMEKCYIAASGYKMLDNYSKETTPLNQIFGGYIRTEVTCLDCRYMSTTFQHFQDLILDIRQSNSVVDALDNFFAVEKLDVDESAYQCERCKKKVPATKKYSIERPPNVLCIQLKRFNLNSFYGGSKISKSIAVQPCLNLTKFKRKCSSEMCEESAPLTYRLVSMVFHHGSSVNSGHYTALGYSAEDKYYYFNDESVHPISISQYTQNSNAYIILYELEKNAFKSHKVCKVQPFQTTNGVLNTIGKNHNHKDSSFLPVNSVSPTVVHPDRCSTKVALPSDHPKVVMHFKNPSERTSSPLSTQNRIQSVSPVTKPSSNSTLSAVPKQPTSNSRSPSSTCHQKSTHAKENENKKPTGQLFNINSRKIVPYALDSSSSEEDDLVKKSQQQSAAENPISKRCSAIISALQAPLLSEVKNSDPTTVPNSSKSEKSQQNGTLKTGSPKVDPSTKKRQNDSQNERLKKKETFAKIDNYFTSKKSVDSKQKEPKREAEDAIESIASNCAEDQKEEESSVRKSDSDSNSETSCSTYATNDTSHVTNGYHKDNDGGEIEDKNGVSKGVLENGLSAKNGVYRIPKKSAHGKPNGWIVTEKNDPESKLPPPPTNLTQLTLPNGIWTVTEVKKDTVHRTPEKNVKNHNNASTPRKMMNGIGNRESINNGTPFKPSEPNTVISNIKSYSHYGYGARITTWNGDVSYVTQEADQERLQSLNKRNFDNDYNDEIDKGKVKKQKFGAHQGNSNNNNWSMVNGNAKRQNPIQQYQNMMNKYRMNNSSPRPWSNVSPVKRFHNGLRHRFPTSRFPPINHYRPGIPNGGGPNNNGNMVNGRYNGRGYNEHNGNMYYNRNVPYAKRIQNWAQ